MMEHTMAEETGWIQVRSGGKFHLLDPSADEVRVPDIAHALGNMCRYTGHTSEFYSVGQHSVLASRYVGEYDGADTVVQLAALFHDAAEAYLVDVPRPLKPILAGYRNIETLVDEAIRLHIGVPRAAWSHPSIKVVDRRLLRTEQRDLMPPAPGDDDRGDVEPFVDEIIALPPASARFAFLARYSELMADAHVRTTLAWSGR
jgi:hypothetical protein